MRFPIDRRNPSILERLRDADWTMTGGIAFGVGLIALMVWVMAKSDQDQLAGCVAPEFVQAIPHVSGSSYNGSGSTSTTVTYIYKCQDGHVIELFGRLSK